MKEPGQKRYLKLQFKITVVMLIMLSIISLVVSGMLTSNIEKKADTIAEDYIKSLPYLVESSLDSYMLMEDKAGVKELVLSLEKDANIMGIHIINSRGDLSCVLAELRHMYDRKYLRMVKKNATFEERFLDLEYDGTRFLSYYKPLENKEKCQSCHDVDEGEYLGALNINIDLTRLTTLLRKEVFEVRTFMIVADIFIFVVLFTMIYILVIRPVSILEKGMQEVADNNLDIRTQISSNDEFGRMSTLFNYMVYSLRKAFSTISSMHKNMLHTDRLMTMGTLTASISHEIKNPLNSIMINADILMMKHPETKPYGDKIMLDAERIRDIIDQTLKFSRVDQDSTACIDVRDFIERITLYVNRTLMKWADIPLELDMDDNLYCIHANPLQLEQVFINILRNAVEAVENSKKPRVRLSAKVKDEMIEFDFEDNGGGIPEETKNRIFTEYYTTKHNGTGLGLTIVKQIVEQSGGTIDFRSEVGKGTVFMLRFPLVCNCTEDSSYLDQS
ncbi:sensor histidine kinase [Limisalsivibrio acetivorans]|uniref:sensor histidine kinase n=1 Tax=Limisalsivibrio acetivorans TaxID=1304888 RepID=UPI0003B6BD2B|nr:HAMP domain-containing sensor histidine kinase [Limisalsivibrio acetivorans]